MQSLYLPYTEKRKTYNVSVLIGGGGGDPFQHNSKRCGHLCFYCSLFGDTHEYYLFCPVPACDGVWLGNEPWQTLADGVPVSKSRNCADWWLILYIIVGKKAN
jgi:hypothetical protein